MKTITLISLSSIILFSCAPNVPTNSNDLTLGAVQSKIYKGQSQAEVMDVLGSPNIVTKDTQGREVWTYDRISSDKNSESGGFWFLFFGKSNASSSSSSKSLTVIITFDEKKNVLDFTYQSLKY